MEKINNHKVNSNGLNPGINTINSTNHLLCDPHGAYSLFPNRKPLLLCNLTPCGYNRLECFKMREWGIRG